MTGHEPCLSLLLAAGAEVDATDEDGDTALTLAAYEGHEACVTALLAAGQMWRPQPAHEVTLR